MQRFTRTRQQVELKQQRKGNRNMPILLGFGVFLVLFFSYFSNFGISKTGASGHITRDAAVYQDGTRAKETLRPDVQNLLRIPRQERSVQDSGANRGRKTSALILSDSIIKTGLPCSVPEEIKSIPRPVQYGYDPSAPVRGSPFFL